MKRDFPLYEGDGIIRGAATPETPADIASSPSMLEGAGKPRLAGPYPDFFEIEKRARGMLVQTIGGLFARLFDWIDASIRRARYRELEKYLGESVDLADLERRLRRIGADRGDQGVPEGLKPPRCGNVATPQRGCQPGLRLR